MVNEPKMSRKHQVFVKFLSRSEHISTKIEEVLPIDNVGGVEGIRIVLFIAL
jgi:hypothetical protein